MNNRWAAALALVLALAVPAAAYAAKPEPAAGQQMITMRLNGKIVIDPQGHVREYRIDTQAPKEVQELLGKAIPTWRFHPVEVDGKAVPAQSPMRVVLTAVRHGEGYMLSIDNVLFRPNTELEYAEELAARDPDQIRFTVQDMRPPAYPADLMRAGIDGIVLLVLRLDAEGRVADAMVSQSSLFNAVGGGSALDRARAAGAQRLGGNGQVAFQGGGPARADRDRIRLYRAYPDRVPGVDPGSVRRAPAGHLAP